MPTTDPTRPIATDGISDDGAITATTTTSTESYKVGSCVALPPEKVIPIIFVPGIMGTNLKAIKDVPGTDIKKGDPMWRPPNGTLAGLGQVGAWSRRDPATRQQMLDPNNTEVDDSGAIGLSGSTAETLTKDEAKRRGWGTVHLDSYGSILNFIDDSLNQVFAKRSDLTKPLEPAQVWKKLRDIDPKDDDAAFKVTDDDIKLLADYHFPVYAVGYNWLLSNKNSGLELGKKIDAIKKEWEDACHEFKKVIIVSHSMGGLVTRYATYKDGSAVLGVVHGVCPTVGTPLAYRRIACGAEKSATGNNFFKNFFGVRPVAAIMGSDASRTTAVMGFSPGALELLPNHLYQKKWLIGEVTDQNGKVGATVSLPDGDPYTTVYQDKSAWYRLLNPDFLDPAGTQGDDASNPTAAADVWDKYLDQLAIAESFHKSLGDFYFGKTYVYYGDDDAHMSFSTVRWRAKTQGNIPTEAQLVAARITSDQGEGERGVSVRVISPELYAENSEIPLTFNASSQDGPGDGTVSKESGDAPRGKSGVQLIAPLKGFDHQGSYNSPRARNMLLFSICQLAKEAG